MNHNPFGRIPVKWLGLLMVLAGLLIVYLNWRQLTDASPPVAASAGTVTAPLQPLLTCRVLTVYDGDTLGCDINGNGRIERPQEEIRLLGVDTPEMHYSHKNPSFGSAHPQDEPYAKDASLWTERHALRHAVYLQYDRRREDRYHRQLAFVYLADKQGRPGMMLNEALLKAGLATPLFLGKNRLYEERFNTLAAQARLERKGLWSPNTK